VTTIEKPRTSGEFATEDIAFEAFDRFVEAASHAFRVYHEVRGEYFHPPPDTEDKGAKIDRILVPLPAAEEAGWTNGFIGIEGKKSGHKIGPLVLQALNYKQCLFFPRESQTPPGKQPPKFPFPPKGMIVPSWVFIYPLENPHGDVESIMVNNRIGHAFISRDELLFMASATCGLSIKADGSVRGKFLPMGRKRGSR
jgi:hypothetical protein